MTNKHTLSMLIILSTTSGYLSPSALADTAVSLQTPNASFGSAEPVIIEIRNTGSKVIRISNPAPWYIIKSRDNAADNECSGSIVFSGEATTPPLTKLPPQTGRAETWRWDHMDDSQTPVEPGEYCVVFDEPLSYPFTIKADTVSPVTVTLSADSGFFRSGKPRILSWSSKNADSCWAPWTTKTTTTGSQEVFPPNQDTRYTITCVNSSYSEASLMTLKYLSSAAVTQTPWFTHSKRLTSNEAFYPNKKGTYGYKFTVQTDGKIIELGMDSSQNITNCGTVYLWDDAGGSSKDDALSKAHICSKGNTWVWSTMTDANGNPISEVPVSAGSTYIVALDADPGHGQKSRLGVTPRTIGDITIDAGKWDNRRDNTKPFFNSSTYIYGQVDIRYIRGQ